MDKTADSPTVSKSTGIDFRSIDLRKPNRHFRFDAHLVNHNRQHLDKSTHFTRHHQAHVRK